MASERPKTSLSDDEIRAGTDGEARLLSRVAEYIDKRRQTLSIMESGQPIGRESCPARRRSVSLRSGADCATASNVAGVLRRAPWQVPRALVTQLAAMRC
jgi:hypothetical protein